MTVTTRELSAMGIRVVSFDLGHTLLFPRYDWYQSIVADAGAEVAEGDLQKREAALRSWFDGMILDEGRKGMDDTLWEQYFRRFFSGLGVREDALGALLERLYREHLEGVGLWTVPAPGAEETLKALVDAGIKVACVSNNDGRLESMIEYQGWTGYFDVMVDSKDIRIAKPDPGIFRFALDQLDLEANEMMHVGDYYSVDVIGARNAGVEGILYDPIGAYGPLDCRVITELGEVVELVS
ncbi:HAD family hydrolase [Gemmatimonadota bacterium]